MDSLNFIQSFLGSALPIAIFAWYLQGRLTTLEVKQKILNEKVDCIFYHIKKRSTDKLPDSSTL